MGAVVESAHIGVGAIHNSRGAAVASLANAVDVVGGVADLVRAAIEHCGKRRL